MISTRQKHGTYTAEEIFEIGFDAGVYETTNLAKSLLLAHIRALNVYLVPGDVTMVSANLLAVIKVLTEFQDDAKR